MKKRRTSEEVTNEMFDEMRKAGDLVVIAKENPKYWCRCKEGKCGCGKPKDSKDFREAFIYRSVKKPDVCFFYKQVIDEDFNVDFEFDRFSSEYVEEFLKPWMLLNTKEYDAAVRKRKVRKVLAKK